MEWYTLVTWTTMSFFPTIIRKCNILTSRACKFLFPNHILITITLFDTLIIVNPFFLFFQIDFPQASNYYFNHGGAKLWLNHLLRICYCLHYCFYDYCTKVKVQFFKTLIKLHKEIYKRWLVGMANRTRISILEKTESWR